MILIPGFKLFLIAWMVFMGDGFMKTIEHVCLYERTPNSLKRKTIIYKINAILHDIVSALNSRYSAAADTNTLLTNQCQAISSKSTVFIGTDRH